MDLSAAPYSRGSVGLGTALLIASLAHAQGPVIRTEVKEVLVDVTVTNKKPGTELTAKDFSIWEDGKAQKINSVSSAGEDPETTQKHFVIYLDFGMMQLSDQALSERVAAGFIEGLASPDRYMAVTTFGSSGPLVLQDFTTATPALKKAVNAPINTRPILAMGPVIGGPMRDLIGSLSAVCNSIAPAPGRKALLLFTGSNAGNSDTFKALLNVCNRANVAIYAIASSAAVGFGSDINRPQANAGIMRNIDVQPAATFTQMLAEGTGGEAFAFSEKLPEQLAAVARQQDEYYRVAYTPPPAKEGSCHTLKVATNVRGLGVKARNEYCTEKQVDLVAGRIAGQGLETRAASAAAGTSSLQATMELPYFYTGPNRASVHLSMDVIPAGMKFDKDKNGLHGEIDVVGTVARADGGTAARFADTVNIDQPDQQHADAFTHATYHYEHQFTVAAGTYTFQLALGAGPNAVAKLEAPLTIPPWNSSSFGISDIALSTETRALDASPSADGPVLEGRGPLVAGGKQFVPSATNRFRRSDQLSFYVEVYDPGAVTANPSGLTASGLTMQYRILDRKTGEVKGDSGVGSIAGFVRPGNPSLPVATRIQVDQLQAGSYRLEVRAADPAVQGSAAKTVDFDLN